MESRFNSLFVFSFIPGKTYQITLKTVPCDILELLRQRETAYEGISRFYYEVLKLHGPEKPYRDGGFNKCPPPERDRKGSLLSSLTRDTSDYDFVCYHMNIDLTHPFFQSVLDQQPNLRKINLTWQFEKERYNPEDEICLDFANAIVKILSFYSGIE